MEETMFRKFLSTTILTLLLAMVTLAQTGKISGTIVDRETNQPLIGANVLVVGTSLGAATDVNGNYNIFNIPPGSYTLKASYLGYQDVIIDNVLVNSGLTTQKDFKLPTKSLETQTVVIVSERPLIQKSATNAVRIVNAEDLETLPVRSMNDVLALQAGVSTLNGVVYMRGSRADETGYTIEGAMTKNIISNNGGNVVSVIPDAVAELQVQAGGFSAEYGNANGGIVSQEFKTGTDQYHASVRVETDNFGNYPGDKFLGTYSYGYSDLTATISGPILSDKVKIFLAGENRFNRDSNPMFFSGNPTAYGDGALFDTTVVHPSALGAGNENNSYILTWPAGNILGDMQNQYTLNGTLTLDMKPLLLRLSGSYNNNIQRNNGNNIINYFDLNRLGYYKSSSAFLNLKGTYLLANNSFIEANINYTDNRGKSYDQLWGDNYLSYGDSLANAHAGYPQFQNLTSGPNTDFVYGFPFTPYGAPISGYAFNKWTSWGGSLAYTSQIGNHELKAGGEIHTWTIRNYGVGGSGGIYRGALNNPDLARNAAAWNLYLQSSLYTDFTGVYGYDFYGNEVNSGPFAPHNPVFGGAYLEDKFEVSDLVIDFGLRYDYINMDTWNLKNPADPTVDLNTKLIPDSAIVPGTKFSYVSPHLGFSFPVTDRTVFHFQYGKYVQAPALTQAYSSPLSLTFQMIGGFAFTNPTAYNPAPIRTTNYEVGFTQQFTDFAAFDATAFYKEINGQLQYAWQYTVSGSVIQKYAVLQNQDYTISKGLEFTLTLRRINRIRAQMIYTYSNAEGTNSYPNSAFGSVQSGGITPTVISPLDYSFTHKGTFNLDYRWGKDDGGPILQQLGVDLLFTFNSGHPFTQIYWTGLAQNSPWTGGLSTDTRADRPSGPINGSTTPWQYNLDLRIDKTVSIFDKLDVNFYVYVQNLLNTQNVVNVYPVTGNAYNDGFLQTPDAVNLLVPGNSTYGPRFGDLYNALNLTNREAQINQFGYDVFGVPRQLRAGLMVNF
jgi:CarboxypepD_reg-like domain/TonB-dependent Receptor Plug Domain